MDDREGLSLDVREFAGIDIPVVDVDDEGRVCVFEDKWDTHLWWQSFVGDDTVSSSRKWPFTMAANGFVRSVGTFASSGKERGDAEIKGFIASPIVKDVGVIVYNQSDNQDYCNKAVPMRCIFGASAHAPGIVPEPIYVSAPNDFVFKLTNLLGSTQKVGPLALARRFFRSNQESRYAAFRSKRRVPFWMAGNDGPTYTIAPSGTLSVKMTVPSWGVFQLLSFLDDSESTTGARPSLTVDITDTRTREKLNTDPLPWLDLVAAHTINLNTPNSDVITAAALDGPHGVFTHLFDKLTDIQLDFTSTDSGTITLRPAARGILYKVDDPHCPIPDEMNYRKRFSRGPSYQSRFGRNGRNGA